MEQQNKHMKYTYFISYSYELRNGKTGFANLCEDLSHKLDSSDAIYTVQNQIEMNSETKINVKIISFQLINPVEC